MKPCTGIEEFLRATFRLRLAPAAIREIVRDVCGHDLPRKWLDPRLAPHCVVGVCLRLELALVISFHRRLSGLPNDRVERPATMTMPRPDAAHYASRSARTRC